jgi:hypothetical protein
VLVDGVAAAHLRRGERELLLWAPLAEPGRTRVLLEVARALLGLAAAHEEGRRGMLLSEIDGVPATTHPAAGAFVRAGFSATGMGLQARIGPVS